MQGERLEIIINRAIKKANEFCHEYLTLEILLWAMLHDKQVVSVISECGAKSEEIEKELLEFLKNNENIGLLTEEQIERLSQEQFVDKELRDLAREGGIRYQPNPTVALQRVIQKAALHVQSSGKKQIMGIHLLVALFAEDESFALYLLTKSGLERFQVVQVVAHGIDTPLTSESAEAFPVGGEEAHTSTKKKSALFEYAINLNEMAAGGRIDPLIGRGDELERIFQILCRRRKNNPLLVGDAGVGKTAIAEGLAWSIIHGKVPSIIKNMTIYSLDLALLLAGAKYRGDFEERLKQVLKELSLLFDQGKESILFIDELHTVMGAGSTGNGSMDASNLLKPALAQGKIRFMGSTTHEEYRRFVEKDPAFGRRFQKLDISEPTDEETYKILQGLKSKFEEHHGVKYSNAVLKTAVELAVKHLSDRKNPDKSIDVIDEAGAMMRLLPENRRKSSVTVKDIEHVISKMAKIPIRSVAHDERDRLKSLKNDLKLVIFGQEGAVSSVVDSILLSRSGLGHAEKPMGSFLFAGPTGVGKTELAKQLAFHLNIHFERFDMSEYMEKHAVAKLIGAPPGYVGFDQGGLLTDAIKKYPHSVLLLDEIEKAHSDIFNILLQVMDHGELMDAHGRKTDFRNIIFIMTTNAGASESESGSIGLSSSSGTTSNKRDLAIKSFFSPEFRNRLDGIIHFNSLPESEILKIVDKFLLELELKLASKNVELVVVDEVKKWLMKRGFDPKMGARPIARVIDSLIKRPISSEILFGKLILGGKISVKLKNDEIDFEFHTKDKIESPIER